MHPDAAGWHSRAGLTDSAEVQQLCLAALGARVSTHSVSPILTPPSGLFQLQLTAGSIQAIMGASVAAATATASRHAASLQLAARALALATQTNLLAPANPTPDTFAATRLLVYTLRTATAGHSPLGTYQRAMLTHRSRVLELNATPTSPDEARCDEHSSAFGRLHVNWALADAALAAQAGADRSFLSEPELALHFGLVSAQLVGDLEMLEAVVGRVEVDPFFAPVREGDTSALSEVVSRACLWTLRALIEVRRLRIRRLATLADVAPTLGFTTSTLDRVSTAWAALTARVALRGPAQLAAWSHATHDVARRLLGVDLFAHGILMPFLSGGDLLRPPERALARAIEWRAARALKAFLSGAQGPVLVPDSLGRPSWLGSCVGSLPPGTGVVDLALVAARDGICGGKLEAVQMTMTDLGVMLDALRVTVELGGPSSEQARALESGIAALRAEVRRGTCSGRAWFDWQADVVLFLHSWTRAFGEWRQRLLRRTQSRGRWSSARWPFWPWAEPKAGATVATTCRPSRISKSA